MVYNWDGRRNEVYQVYVVERKSLDELAQHMKDNKRAYQTQFKKWNFPRKLTPAHRDEELVARVKQLWELNVGHKQMVKALADDGFDVNDTELMRLRSRFGWLLRGASGYNSKEETSRARKRKQSSTADDEDNVAVEGQTPVVALVEHDHEEGAQSCALPEAATESEAAAAAGALKRNADLLESRARALEPDPELRRQHQERARELQEQSDKLWASKKRRRRTQGFAGLPADPPQPPRYPSETTIDESKAFLHLDNAQYQVVRECFEKICGEEEVIKKTLAGREKWQYVKDRLTTENSSINREFYGPYNGVPHQSKTIALDVICLDVTKTIRDRGRRMTLADAKNLLGLNPRASREARAEFYEVLREGHFLSKAETGVERWEELKQSWIARSTIIQEALQRIDTDGQFPDEETTAKRRRAVDVLCRDVMKRVRDDITKADPTLKRNIPSGPGPGPAQAKYPPARADPTLDAASPVQVQAPTSPSPAEPSPAAALRRKQTQYPPRHIANIRKAPPRPVQQPDAHIDPSLAQASSPISVPSPAELQAFAASANTSQQPMQQPQVATMAARIQQQQHQRQKRQEQTQPTMEPPSRSPTTPNVTTPTPTRPLAALFRLHASAAPALSPKTWLGTLSSARVTDLLEVARASFIASRGGSNDDDVVAVKRIEGMMVSGGASQGDGSVPFPIERDDELEAYCGFVSGPAGMGKAVFVVGFE